MGFGIQWPCLDVHQYATHIRDWVNSWPDICHRAQTAQICSAGDAPLNPGVEVDVGW